MEGLLFLMVVGLGFYVLSAVGKIKTLQERLEELDDHVRRLHIKVVNQLGELTGAPSPRPASAATPEPVTNFAKREALIPCPSCKALNLSDSTFCDECGEFMKPKPSVTPPVAPAPMKFPESVVVSAASSIPPAPSKPVLPYDFPAAPKQVWKLPQIDWEKFMGVKLFAWLGGFALFMGMAFFVKYSIDHNLVSPLMRVSIGFLTGIGVIIGGLLMRKKGYSVTVQTLCAAGIAILYADTFAARTAYGFLSTEVAFAMMVLVTVSAFFLAVRLDSKYVAILGLVGGFLTPPLLSTGVDHPIALFSYILLLDTGLAAVTLRQKWGFLLSLSSCATFLMEAGWTVKFFTPEKAWLAVGIYVTFGIFFLAVAFLADQRGFVDKAFQEAADYVPLLSMGFVAYLLSFPALGAHPGVIFTLLFSILALLGWRASFRAESQLPYGLGVVSSFLLLGVWTLRYMVPAQAVLTAALYLALCLFAFFVSWRSARSGKQLPAVEGAANYLPLVAFTLVAYFLTLTELGHNPFLIFSLIFLFCAMLAWRALFGKSAPFAYALGVLAGFSLLSAWTFLFMDASQALMISGIYLAYCFFHLGISRASAKAKPAEQNLHSPADFLPLLTMGLVAYMLRFPSLGHRPGLVLTLLLVLGGLLAYRALKRTEARLAYGLGGAVSFILLMVWTMRYMHSSLLLWGLGYFMAFAVLHTLFPILWQRLRPSAKPLLAGFVAPMLGLVLILVAMVACDLLSFILWPFVLLLGFLGIALAWLAGSLAAAAGSVLLVMACFGVWLFRLPDGTGLSEILTLLAVFSGAFFAWTLLVTRGRSLFPSNAMLSQAGAITAEDAAQIPALTAGMPFVLLMMVCIRLPLVNPTNVFLLALFLDVLLLALARYRKLELLVPVALASTATLEFIWLARNTPLANPMLALNWAIVFYAVFAIFPFVVRRHLRGTAAWISSALSGIAQWPVVWVAVDGLLGHSMRAVVPAFFALPSLTCLGAASLQSKDEHTLSKFAWFGGISLLFITLIIPIQFDKEWLTVGWTLEGAALLWLRRRVPHEGLKAWGAALLGICFVRLALNPAVFSYHPRSGAALFNWYLWVYGIAALAYYAGAWFMQPSPRLLGSNVPPLLNSAGTLLAFLLVNIEIADYFSTGSVITFNFSGNLAQDMTYSLCWAVFAVIMLMAGIRTGSRGARYASVGLLLGTILKVFLHDLWRLGQLYRVASFIGLAIILILVSFLYQKFLTKEER